MLVPPRTKVLLKDYDPANTGKYKSAEEAAPRLQELQHELSKLQGVLYAEAKRTILIVLQGMDTSGKDGTIRHVMSAVSPLGVQVTAFKAPSEEERAHDFLWRVHHAVPRQGYLGIFNRSHYEDVLVVRVHELAPRRVWKTRYKQINQFERILTRNNVIILKFFLHISKDEQKKRLEARLQDPTRHWKLTLEDIEDRKNWDAYQKAYEVVLRRCNTKWAAWHIVPADHKWYRDLVVAETVVEAMSQLDMCYPAASIDLSKLKIE